MEIDGGVRLPSGREQLGHVARGHDHAVADVEDSDLREALLRGISETGVPTIETEWVPVSKQSEIGPTFTKIARPTLQCMFDPATN